MTSSLDDDDDETPPDVEQQIAALRPLLTETFHALAPAVALIDCAVRVNALLDEAAHGDVRHARLLRDVLQGVLDASDRAQRRRDEEKEKLC